VLPQMRRQRSGRILLVSSVTGQIGLPFGAYYSASKFALEGFGESLAHEVAPFGITVTLLQPAKAIEVRQRGMANGAPPARVARTVQRLLESPRPPRRRSAGKARERTGVISKRILPFRLWEAGSKKGLGVG
jgi:NAD(P)-dependent dehydrogenase (short-subunit alcohol dehydrogenase family)